MGVVVVVVVGVDVAVVVGVVVVVVVGVVVAVVVGVVIGVVVDEVVAVDVCEVVAVDVCEVVAVVVGVDVAVDVPVVVAVVVGVVVSHRVKFVGHSKPTAKGRQLCVTGCLHCPNVRRLHPVQKSTTSGMEHRLDWAGHVEVPGMKYLHTCVASLTHGP